MANASDPSLGDHDPLATLAAPSRSPLDDALSLGVFARQQGLPIPAVRVGRFEVLRKLGRGGQGSVYVARDPALGREVAVKVQNPDDERSSARQRHLFLREARALACVNHDNVVEIYDFGESTFGPWMAMELVVGEDLAAWRSREQPGWPTILAAYLQAAAGLAAAHELGVVHRDVKPHNLLRRADGRVLVADFGLARAFAHEATPSDPARHAGSSTLSRAGGTPRYAAPEQLRSLQADARSDQFSLCVSLCESTSGERPYDDDLLMQLQRGVDVRLPRPRLPTTWPPRLRRAVERALAQRPQDRFPSLHELLDAIQRPPRRARLGIAAAVPFLLFAVFDASPATTPDCERSAIASAGVTHAAAITALDATIAARPGGDDAVAWRSAIADLRRRDREIAAAFDDACRSDPARGDDPSTVEASTQCLSRRSEQIAAIAALLVESADRMPVLPERIFDQLDAVDDCRPAHDPPQAAHDEVRRAAIRRIDASRAALAMAEFAKALGSIDEVLRDGVLDDDPQLDAEARFTRAQILDAVGRDDDAYEELLAAASLAEVSRHDTLAPRVWHALVHVAAVDRLDLASARDHAAREASATRRLGEPPLLRADLAMSRASVENLAGDLTAARAQLQDALALRRAHLSADDPSVAETLKELATNLSRAGDLSRGDELYAQAHRIYADRLGASHPSVATVEFDLGLNAMRREAFDVARNHFERALASQLHAFGSDAPGVAPTLVMLAQLDLGDGELDAALAKAERAKLIQERHLPRGHPDRGSALAMLSAIHLARDDKLTALSVTMARIADQAPGVSPAEENEVINLAGWLLCELERCSEALPYYQRLWERAASDAERAYAAAGIGRAELARGNIADADARLALAKRLAASLPDRDDHGSLRAEIERDLALARATQPIANTDPHRVIRALDEPDVFGRLDYAQGD